MNIQKLNEAVNAQGFIHKNSGEMQTPQNQPPQLPPTISNASLVGQTSNSPSQRSPRESSLITIVYSTDGPLGLEFEDMNFPYQVEGVRMNGVSAEKGVRKGDFLVSVNGKSTESLVWDEIRAELSSRPATAVFRRDLVHAPSATSSVWSLGAGLMGGLSSPEGDSLVRQERDELKEIVTSLGVEDMSRLRHAGEDLQRSKRQLRELEVSLETVQVEKEQAIFLLEEEKIRSNKLVEVIDEIEKSQQSVVERFELELQERERQLKGFREKQEASMSCSSKTPDANFDLLRESLAQAEAKLELIEKDNSRLRVENAELGGMVQKCLEKIQRDLSDKPHWVDRRVLTRAIGNFLSELDNLDESSSKANGIDVHLRARQKLGDVLGLTEEERVGMRLLSYPSRLEGLEEKGGKSSISKDFLEFLEKETVV